MNVLQYKKYGTSVVDSNHLAHLRYVVLVKINHILECQVSHVKKINVTQSLYKIKYVTFFLVKDVYEVNVKFWKCIRLVTSSNTPF